MHRNVIMFELFCKEHCICDGKEFAEAILLGISEQCIWIIDVFESECGTCVMGFRSDKNYTRGLPWSSACYQKWEKPVRQEIMSQVVRLHP